MALGGTRVIALEEHYLDPEVAKHYGDGAARAPALRQRLDDLGELRLREMDEAGIDLQVISHVNPGTQRMYAATAVPLARRANDALYEMVSAYPDRWATAYHRLEGRLSCPLMLRSPHPNPPPSRGRGQLPFEVCPFDVVGPGLGHPREPSGPRHHRDARGRA